MAMKPWTPMTNGFERPRGEKRIEESVSTGHWDTWQQGWMVERRHLQGQIQRDLAAAKKKKAAAAEEAKRRRARLEGSWKSEDGVVTSHVTSQSKISSQESQIRKADDVNVETARQLHASSKSHLQLGNRDKVETTERNAEHLSHKHNEEHWKYGIARGAKEYDLEQQTGQANRGRAVRGFGWAKDDEKHNVDCDQHAGTSRLSPTRLVATRLPTSPVPGGHSQSPGMWRVEHLSMLPGAWKTEQLDGQMERAKTAAWHGHNRRVNDYSARAGARTTCLNNWADTCVNVGTTHYGAWRLKADATSPSTHAHSFWPSKSTHRISPPVTPLSART